MEDIKNETTPSDNEIPESEVKKVETSHFNKIVKKPISWGVILSVAGASLVGLCAASYCAMNLSGRYFGGR